MEKQTGRLTRVKGRKGDMPVHGTENKHEIQTDKAIGAEGSNTEDLTSATDPLLQKIPDTWVKDCTKMAGHRHLIGQGKGSPDGVGGHLVPHFAFDLARCSRARAAATPRTVRIRGR